MQKADIATLRNLFDRWAHYKPAFLHRARAAGYSRNWTAALAEPPLPADAIDNVEMQSSNPLKSYFDSHAEGRGIWKWDHYFEIYHRHLSKFVGREVHCVEIGVYSGGSLEMWKQYLGPASVVYGVDVVPACRVFEDERTRISIGDQADRTFWRRFKERYPVIDVLIDDGGHRPEQMIVTLEEMLPHLRPGGVYLCEDVHGGSHGFSSYIHSLAATLNANVFNPNNPNGRMACSPTPFQAAIHSVHLYPYVAVIEKNDRWLAELVAPKRGTEWQPFDPRSRPTGSKPTCDLAD